MPIVTFEHECTACHEREAYGRARGRVYDSEGMSRVIHQWLCEQCAESVLDVRWIERLVSPNEGPHARLDIAQAHLYAIWKELCKTWFDDRRLVRPKASEISLTVWQSELFIGQPTHYRCTLWNHQEAALRQLNYRPVMRYDWRTMIWCPVADTLTAEI